jgi:hypothetical protein
MQAPVAKGSVSQHAQKRKLLLASGYILFFADVIFASFDKFLALPHSVCRRTTALG